MSDQKVFIFGSFTEDETRLFQNQPAQKSFSGKAGSHHASGKIELQFGSLDVTSLSSVKGFDHESKITTAERSKVTQSPNLLAKDPSAGNRKSSNDNHLLKAIEAQENGISNKSFSTSKTMGNGLVDCNSAMGHVCDNGRDNIVSQVLNQRVSDKPANPDIIKLDGIKNANGAIDESSAVKPAVDAHKKLSEQSTPSRSLLPRGLINLGNLCFLNATLQALLSCSPFVQLLLDLANREVPKVGYPTLRAFVEFISVFGTSEDPKGKKQERGVIQSGKPFSPVMFDPVLSKFTPDIPSSLSGRPRQEDAQEFLSFVMDRMHDELLKLEGRFSNSNGGNLLLVSSTEDDGWETVGPKNKSAITRTQSFIPSELSAIFGGQLNSVVKAQDNRPSATVQPFLLLHLDILSDAVHTIEDALHLFSAPETLEGYRASTGKAGIVNASKSVKIQTLSKILILHLMRFSYGSGGSTKLHKPVQFPLELVLSRDLLLYPNTKGRKYELVATITHHGQEPSKGHYTADTRHSDGQWLRFDDASVTAVGTAVGMSKVLHDQAYLLFYKQV